MAENEDRTEQATPKRRQKAREKGQLARSRELVSMVTMSGVLFVFYFSGVASLKSLSGLTGRLLGLQYGRDSLTVMRAATIEMMLILAPFFAAAVVFAVFSNVFQGGFLIKPLTLSYEKLNPLSGLKNLFSMSKLPEAVKSTFKFVIGAVLIYLIVQQGLALLPATMAMDLPDIQTVAFGLTKKAVAYAFITYLALAAADYAYAKWKFERSIRMSKQEIRDEHRESEGDPKIKARIKSVQRELARRRMMEAVPTATVVITNPTHIAVALLYRKNESAAPKVVAKGKGFVAQNIRDLARRHGVPIMEDKPLARSLFKVKLGSSIPEELYKAVAKILAYIYKLRGAAA